MDVEEKTNKMKNFVSRNRTTILLSGTTALLFYSHVKLAAFAGQSFIDRDLFLSEKGLLDEFQEKFPHTM